MDRAAPCNRALKVKVKCHACRCMNRHAPRTHGHVSTPLPPYHQQRSQLYTSPTRPQKELHKGTRGLRSVQAARLNCRESSIWILPIKELAHLLHREPPCLYAEAYRAVYNRKRSSSIDSEYVVASFLTLPVLNDATGRRQMVPRATCSSRPGKLVAR